LEEKVIDKGSCEMMSIWLVEMMRSSRSSRSTKLLTRACRSLLLVNKVYTGSQGQRLLCKARELSVNFVHWFFIFLIYF
jgi:hypothetical protein